MNYLTVVGTCVHSLGAPMMMKKEEEYLPKRDLFGVSRVFFHLYQHQQHQQQQLLLPDRRISDLYGFDTAHPSRIGSRSSLADSDGKKVSPPHFPRAPAPKKGICDA